VAYLLGGAVVVALLRPSASGRRFVPGVLAALWAWTGIAYHGIFFAAINPAAWGFAALFLLQGALFAWAAAGRRMDPTPRGGPVAWAGWFLVLYALVLYPVLGWLLGQRYPSVPVFGITPCPLTLFTFGVLLVVRSAPRRLLVVPALWALVGGSAAALLHVPQDWLLLASVLAVLPLLPAARRARAG
jgi:hypothetical protein